MCLAFRTRSFDFVAENGSCGWLALCVPDDQTVHPRAELHRGFYLNPVSGVGEAVGHEKIGGY